MSTDTATLRRSLPRPKFKLTLGALRSYGIVLSFGILFIGLSIASSNFLTWSNLENILSQQSPTLIVAAAGTLVLIAGGFDLSVGGIAALGAIVSAKLAGPLGPAPAIAAALLTGLGLGVANGAIITLGGINPLVGTLATSFVFRGLAVAATTGLLVTVTNPSFATLGQGHVLGIPVEIVVAVAIVGVIGYALERMTFGRRVFAVGGNAEAARIAGIRVGAVRAATFALSGLCAGVAGAILASQVSSAAADTATGLEFTVLAGIIVGGTSIQGGEGAIWRTVIGVLFIALINNGFTLLGLNPTYEEVVQGTIILLAVGLDTWSRRAGRRGR
jgi:ribose transport system permease protein